MIRVSLNFGWASQVTLDQQAGGKSAERHCCGKKQRLARHDLLRRPDVGHDRSRWPARAGAEAGKCQRGTHELQKLATADPILPLCCLPRELAVQELLKPLGCGQFFQASPILPTLDRAETRTDRSEIQQMMIFAGCHDCLLESSVTR